MKRTFVAGLVLVLAGAAAAELKVVTVDLDEVFTAHPKTQAAEAELKKAEEAVQADLEKMVAEGRALEEEVAKLREAAKSPVLTEEARRKKNDEAEDKLTELQEFQLRLRRTQETKLKQMREQLAKTRQGIVDELMVVVADFAKAEGLDLVLGRSGMTMNMIPLAIYSNPDLDVTDRLIKQLQDGTKSEATEPVEN